MKVIYNYTLLLLNQSMQWEIRNSVRKKTDLWNSSEALEDKVDFDPRTFDGNFRQVWYCMSETGWGSEYSS